jgi:hypothetical protein
MRETYRRFRESLTIDQKINVLLIVVGLVTASTLILAALIYPQVTSSSAGIEAQADSDQIAACRSSYRAEIDTAVLRLAIAQSRSDELIRRGLAAVALRDRETLDEIAHEAERVDERIEQAVNDAARANDAYARAVEQSAEDPDAFLASCT